jgi:tRNA/rRNA methyltransferase
LRFDRTSLTLVGPEYPINVGYIARLAKNFGISQMYLVEPKFDRRVAMVYAAHGSDIVEEAKEITLKALRKDHDLLVATTAISATRRVNMNRLSMDPETIAQHISPSTAVSFVFGRDTTGLKNNELDFCDMVTTIRTGTSYRTMNVSHSAAVLLYILSRTAPARVAAPNLMERDAFAQYAYDLAVASGVQRHRAQMLKRLAKRTTVRSGLDGKEIGLLVSLMRKALMKIESAQTLSKT